MMKLARRTFVPALGALAATAAAVLHGAALPASATDPQWQLSDDQWRKRLTPEQFDVLRRHSTEAPFSNALDHEEHKGTYACAGCALPLYSSATKFDSHTGWPSFYAPLPGAIATRADYDLGMLRTEVHCKRCEGHLGHVFDDGPRPTGLRYCMNGTALTFKKT